MKTELFFQRTGASMRTRAGLALAAAVLLGACDLDLDVTNPNAPTEAEVLADLNGVLALSLGMQNQFAEGVIDYVRAPALVTDEWGTQTRALAADQSLFLGEGIDAGYGVVNDPYFTTYRVARSANNILDAVPDLGLAPGLEVGLTATARLFKAMALGMAAQQFERLPVDAVLGGAPLVPRAQVFAEAIRLLEAARTDLGRVTDAELATFRSRGLSPGVELRSTVDAMLARFYLITGQWQQALTAANRVNPGATSVLNYTDPGRNPIWNYGTQLLYVAPLKSYADQAEAGDRRVAFWVGTGATPFNGNPPVPLLPFAYYNNRNAAFPLFLPGEILLIRAEAQARLGNLAAARDLINQVRTKTGTATLPGAGLPALPADSLDTLEKVLAQISYERRYELFGQGLRWEDLRRLGQYVGRQPKVGFLPTPETECRNNPQAGC